MGKKDIRFEILVDQEFSDLIDAWRAKKGFPTPSRGEAARTLMERGLEAEEKGHKS